MQDKEDKCFLRYLGIVARKSPRISIYVEICFWLRLLDMSDIIFSIFAIFASILVDTFSSSFIRFLKFCDDAFDINRLPQTTMRGSGYMS